MRRGIMRGKLFKWSLINLLICLLVSVFAVSGFAQEGSQAPMNPDFLEYLEAIQATGKAAAPQLRLTDEGYALGYIPGPFNRSHLQGQKSASQGVSYPVSYDLRSQGKLTSVRDQGSCGSCWTFATYGSLESNMLPGTTWDFSENNLNTAHGFDWNPCDGGNADISMAYLARWSGPLTETQEPYNAADTTRKAVTSPNSSRQGNVLQALTIPLRASSSDNDNIKAAVTNYGAVYTSFYWNSGYYKSATAAYYYSGSSSSNHAVAIVGWDDNYAASNFATAPPGNGAFIVRNSWGASWGQSGYFYVSYYDSKFGKSENAIFKNLDRSGAYQTIYQYDPFGNVGNYGYSSTTGWFANVFTATASHDLGAVGFFTAQTNSSYEIYIYTNVTSGPRTGTLTASKTGTLSDAGYNYVTLSSAVPLTSGQKFSIVVKLTTPGYNYPVPVEYSYSGYSSNATASPGQSYMSSDGSSWSDATTAVNSTANVCVKGYAGTAGGNSAPATPTQTSPASGATGQSLTPTMQASAFSDPDAGDTHANSQWQVSRNSGFTDLAWDSGEGYAAGVQVTVPSDRLTGGTTYWWRVRYKDNHGLWSNYQSSPWSFTTGGGITLGDALDNTSVTWTTGGSANWRGQSQTKHDGVDAAQSGVITDSQESWVQTTATTGAGNFSFWWKVSSESGYDYLEFYIDGVLQHSISGEVDWQQKTYSISSGSHTFKWRYYKDGSVSTGSDAGWVDQVVIPGQTCTYTLNPTSKSFPTAGGTGTVEVTTQSGCTWDATSNNSWISIDSSSSGFDSSFNTDASGWTQHYGTWTVGSGSYNTPGVVNYYSSASHDGDYSNFTYRASVKRDGTLTTVSNIFVRGTPEPLTSDKKAWNNGYDFGYGNQASDTEYRIIKWVNGVSTTLQPWTATSAINPRSWNELKVVASGTSLSFYINNVLVWQGTDSSLTTGRAGVGMYSDGQSGADFHVDWATLTTSASAVSASSSDVISPAQLALNQAASKDPANLMNPSGFKGNATVVNKSKGAVQVDAQPIPMPPNVGATGSGTVNYTVAQNTGVVRDGSITIAQQNFPVHQEGAGVTLGEALDNTSLTWTTGGSANWYGQTQTKHDSTDAAQSGAITDSQESWVQTTVNNQGTLSFWWKVSSESGYDFLEFYIDDVLQHSISGEVDWQQKSYNIGSGSHTLKWKYRKDGSLNSGSDAGWVDQVVWTLNTCTYTLNPTSAHFTASGGTGTVDVTTQSGCEWNATSNSDWITIDSSGSGFNSDFNSNASGWTQHSGTWTVGSGSYNTPGVVGYYASASQDGNYSNFTYRTSVKREGLDTNANSIFIRGTPEPLSSDGKYWNDGYDFGFANNGSYRIVKFINGSVTWLQDWTTSSAISATGWNELKVVASGSRLSFYINNTLVWEGTDTSLTTGRAGFGMYAGESGQQFHVDWATLTTSTSASSASSSDVVSPEQLALNQAASQDPANRLNPYEFKGAATAVNKSKGAKQGEIQPIPMPKVGATGSGTVYYTVAQNNSAARPGSMTIAATTFNVDQDAAVVLPTVTVTATDSSATEGGDTGTYRISSTGDTGSALSVYYAMSGTAACGSSGDYTLSSGCTGAATIAAGQTYVDVTLTALTDTVVEGTETAIMTISSNSGYTVGSPSNATVNIVNVDPKPTVTVSATDSSATEGGDTGTYRISRSGGNASSTLSVYYTMSGTATCGGGPGGDYTLPGGCGGPVTIAANTTYVDVTLTAVRDSISEPTETAVMTISSNSAYTVGSPSNATVNIANRNSLPPNTPTGSGPANGSTNVSLTPTLQASAFSDPDAGDTHAKSQWQVAKNYGFTDLVWDSGAVSGSTQAAVSKGLLNDNTTYGWRVRYQDNYGVWSSWSSPWSFTTGSATNEIGAPISWSSSKIAALFADYGGDSGIWSHDGNSWNRLTDWKPAGMISYGTSGILATFNAYGSGNGLYKYDGSSWSMMTNWVPSQMISYGSNMAGVFDGHGGDSGLYRHNGSSWSKLTDWLPDTVVTTGSNELVALFSQYDSGNGLWRHDGSGWNNLTSWLPETITAWGSRLATVFTNYGDSNGLWIYEGSSWKKATDWLPSKVISWKGDAQLAAVFADYGSGNGIWSYDGSSWKKLTDWIPLDMTKLGTDEIAAVFDDDGIQSGNGIWKYNFTSQSWQWVTDWVPAAISSSGDYLNGVFDDYGSGNGVWKYRNGNWSRLTDWTSNKPKP